MKRTRSFTLAFVLLLILSISVAAQAAEIRVLCSNGLKAVMEDAAPQFERASGHKVVMKFGLAAGFKQQIEAGEAFDLAVLTPALIDDLIKQGKLTAVSRVVVARSGLGVAVRKGAPKPDLSTADAFKRTVVNAKSIGFNERGLTGIYLWSLFDKLGLTAVVKAKFKDGSGATMAGTGQTEIGLTQASEIALVPEAELAGRLPAEIQHFTVFPAAISASAREPDAARSLLKFLASPEALKVMREKGLEPPA